MDWLFFTVMGGGLGVLAAAARRRAAATRHRIARLGMSARADLTRIPVELQHTALWALTLGGTEHSVVGGRLSLAAHDLDVTCFDLEDLRHKGLEWGWLDVATPFRLHTPLSIVACTLPRALPHVLVKRAGAADRIEPRASETGGRGAARLVDMKPFAAPPPATLARDTVDVPLEPGWRAWADPAAGDAARHLLAALGPGLEAAAHDRELVIETVGPLLVAYVASGAPLAADGLEDLVDVAAPACERVLAATPDLDPRGVSG